MLPTRIAIQAAAAGYVFGCVLACSVVLANGLEPETGVFAGYGPPDPYDLVLRGTLLGDDNYRLCQMITIPSFWEESAVYMVRQTDGSATVISRTLKAQLWGRMQSQIQRMSKDRNSFSVGPESQRAALERLRPAVDTDTASLDSATTAFLADICRIVLLQVQYREKSSIGFDGTTYHAGHWVPGMFLSGTTWSPQGGTIAADFVAMEEALQAFAKSAPRQRDAVKADLIQKATRLRNRVTQKE